MMNKKNLPHIITVVSFVVFIVLGVASVTLASAPEGYGTLTIVNNDSKLSINLINVKGVSDRTYSKSYQVNLRPAGSGALSSGGSFQIGDDIEGKKLVPIGDYEITLRWSNGAQTTDKVTVYNPGVQAHYGNP